MSQQENKGKFREFFMSSWAIDNRTTVYILTFILVLLGLMSYNTLPKENFPEIAIPTIYVGTPYPGYTPQEIEQNVTYYIEKELKSTKGVKEIKSQSIQDYSIVVVEFETNVDLKEAKREVQEGVDRAGPKLPKLPNGQALEPMVRDINLSEIPIMFLNVSGDLPPQKLKQYAEDLADLVEALEEISRVDIAGGEELEVQVNLNLPMLQAKGVSIGDVENAIRQRNIQISAGNLTVGDQSYALKADGTFQNMKELNALPVRNGRGQVIPLVDLLTEPAALKPKDAESYARLNGQPVITLNVIKNAGENLVSASEKINKIVAEFEQKLPENISDHMSIVVNGDQSQMTKNMLNELTNTIIIGFLLVTFVLMFFMGVRDSMFVGFSVPLSSLIAFVVLPWLGFTLNLVVLFTFIFALGIVVDNAIVVIENTHRIYNHEKIPIVMAAKKAAGEVITPVFAGTLTTMAPFLPLAFWEGTIGEFMFFLPVTIIITLFASLLVAYVINPVFAVSFMKREDEEKPQSTRAFIAQSIFFGIMTAIGFITGARVFGNVFLIILVISVLYRFVIAPAIKGFQRKVIPAMMNVYRGILRWSLTGKRPYLVLGGTMVIFILSLVVMSMRQPKVIFFPETDPNMIFVYNAGPISQDIEKTNAVTKELERRVYEVIGKDNPIVKAVITNVAVGAGEQSDFNRTNSLPHKSRIQIEFVEYKYRNGVSTMDILDGIREKMRDVPGTVVTVEKEQGGPPTKKPVNIEIKGEDLAFVLPLARDLKNYLEGEIAKGRMKGVEELKWDVEEGKREMIINVDYDKAAELGMNASQIAMAIRAAVFGSDVGNYRELEDEYPIMVRLDSTYRSKEGYLREMTITFRDMATGLFRTVPVSSVASFEYRTTLGGLNRLDLSKVVRITSNILSDYNPTEAVLEVTQYMDKWKREHASELEGVTVEMNGQLQEQEETSVFLGMAMMISLLLIFLILVAQFNSIAQVAIILTQIVFSMIGVFLGFALSGMDISVVMAGVGIVSLAGIVVNNGIILLDFIGLLKKQGTRTREAIIEGGATRFIPVLLTASSTILGLVPLAVSMNISFGGLFTELDPAISFGGDNAAFWGPLSWTVIYGLSFATFITLIVVPVLYYVSYTNGIVLGRKIRRIRKRISSFMG